MKTTEAVILAGGMGTRLQMVVPDRPKPMALVNGRPFLEYLLDYLVSQGIARVILSVGYMKELIITHFGNKYRSIDLDYAQEKEPLGTGGGLRNAFTLASSESLFVLNGDTWFPVPLEVLESGKEAHNASLVIALRKVTEGNRYGAIETGPDGRILKFAEKGSSQGPVMINGGIYLIEKQLLTSGRLQKRFSLETGFFEKQVSRKRFFGVPFDVEFIDIGIPESYRAAGAVLSK